MEKSLICLMLSLHKNWIITLQLNRLFSDYMLKHEILDSASSSCCVLTPTILPFQLSRQYISGRHVSLLSYNIERHYICTGEKKASHHLIKFDLSDQKRKPKVTLRHYRHILVFEIIPLWCCEVQMSSAFLLHWCFCVGLHKGSYFQMPLLD